MNSKVGFSLVAGAALALAASLATAPDAQAAAFMKIASIPGESRDKDHKEWIIIESMSSPLLDTSGGGGGGTCPAAAAGNGHVTVLKAMDSSTPGLHAAMCGTDPIPRVEIHVHGGKRGEPYYAYELRNVLISSYSVGTAPDKKGRARAVESFSLNYTEVEWTFISDGREP